MPANTDKFRENAPNFATQLTGSISASDTTITLQGITGLPTTTAVTLTLDGGTSAQEVVVGVVNTGGSQLVNCLRGVGWFTAADWNAALSTILQQHTQAGAHTGLTTDTLAASGNATVGGTLGVTGNTTLTGTLAAGASTLASLALNGSLTGTGLASQVQSQANAGTAGGTMYYINLGGIKLLWLITANQASTPSSSNYTVIYPTSFFTTIQSVSATAVLMTAQANQYIDVSGSSLATTTQGFYFCNSGGTATTAASIFVIGT
jgi:hypothetical protein